MNVGISVKPQSSHGCSISAVFGSVLWGFDMTRLKIPTDSCNWTGWCSTQVITHRRDRLVKGAFSSLFHPQVESVCLWEAQTLSRQHGKGNIATGSWELVKKKKNRCRNSWKPVRGWAVCPHANQINQWWKDQSVSRWWHIFKKWHFLQCVDSGWGLRTINWWCSQPHIQK